MYTILTCGVELSKRATRGKHITICLYSRAAYMGLSSDKIKTRLASECTYVPNELAKRNKVMILWVRTYIGIMNNEEAVRLAKEWARMYPIDSEPILDISKCQIVFRHR